MSSSAPANCACAVSSTRDARHDAYSRNAFHAVQQNVLHKHASSDRTLAPYSR